MSKIHRLEFEFKSMSLKELQMYNFRLYKLLHKARKAALSVSYSPYSGFLVGSAMMFDPARVLTGANQENASYGAVCCAERTTLFSAYNEGYRGKLKFVAISAKPKDAESGIVPVPPCGICRQVLYEEECLSGRDVPLILDCFRDDEIHIIPSVKSILPLAFGPSNLK